MSFWEKIRNDLEEGIAEGIDIVKEGAAFVKERTERFTKAGKNKFTLFELKIKVRREMAELGGCIYDLKDQTENPLLDDEVKAIITRIRGIEDRIAELEGKAGEEVAKTSAGPQTGEAGEMGAENASHQEAKKDD